MTGMNAIDAPVRLTSCDTERLIASATRSTSSWD